MGGFSLNSFLTPVGSILSEVVVYVGDAHGDSFRRLMLRLTLRYQLPEHNFHTSATTVLFIQYKHREAGYL